MVLGNLRVESSPSDCMEGIRVSGDDKTIRGLKMLGLRQLDINTGCFVATFSEDLMISRLAVIGVWRWESQAPVSRRGQLLSPLKLNSAD